MHECSNKYIHVSYHRKNMTKSVIHASYALLVVVIFHVVLPFVINEPTRDLLLLFKNGLFKLQLAQHFSIISMFLNMKHCCTHILISYRLTGFLQQPHHQLHQLQSDHHASSFPDARKEGTAGFSILLVNWQTSKDLHVVLPREQSLSIMNC